MSFSGRESFCPSLASLVNRHKQMPSESSVIWCLQSKAHTSPATLTPGDYPEEQMLCWLFFYPHLYPRHLDRCFTQQGWFPSDGVGWGDGGVPHLHMSFLSFSFPLCSGWGLVGWLKILWFSRDSEIYLSNLELVCLWWVDAAARAW